MNYLRRRERRRLLEDLINLQYQSFMYNRKELKRSQSDSSDEDNQYRNYQQRNREYCLIKIIYQNPNIRRRRRKFDEITIIQHNQIVFKGCLKDGDQFTFKSQRYQNESKLKLKFYINDVFEEEMIACCQHGLIDRNRHTDLFQIEKIVGAKPCYNCEFEDDTSEISNSNSRQNSFRKEKISPSSSIINQSYEEKSKEKKSTLLISQTTNSLPLLTPSSASEDFSGQLTEFNDEDTIDIVPSIVQSTVKRTYGPPQLSITESFDSPSSIIREPTTTTPLFNSTANTQQRIISEINQNESIPLSMSTQYQVQSSVTNAINENEQISSTNNNSNVIDIANDATELILARLGITPQQQIERSNVDCVIPPREKGNVEYFILIYLNELYPDESIIQHLRSLVNHLKIFDDSDDCIAFINSILNEKIILIISNIFHKTILSRVEELQQIFTIYILSENNNQLDLSIENSKIQGYYNNINNIYEQILIDIKKLTRDLIIYLNTSSNAISIEPMITYFLLLSEIILDSTENKNNIKELVNFSRQEYEGNNDELKIIDEFEEKYQKNQAIYWYSRSCFISKMLNKALRIPEPDILFRFRSFIQDLHQQIQTESISEAITVYLGQTIQRNDLDDLQNNILTNDIIIFPQFLFGSTDENRAIHIAKEIPLFNKDFIPIIIRIDIPENFKCANLNSHRYTIDENNNILLNVGIIGRLIKIEKDNIHENQIASIHLELIKFEEQKNIQQILDITRIEVKSFSTFVGLIKLMIQMNQQTLAEQLVQTMYKDEILKSDVNFQGSIAASCHVLAQLYRTQEDYKHALDLYLLSLNVFLRIISPNSIELSTLYSNIGSMYFRLENYEKSSEYYQIALDTQLHSNTPDLYSISSFTNSIGIIYSKQKKYSQAIKYFERTLKILQQCSQSHDVELAGTYDDLGDAYISQFKYDDALYNYHKALEIQERILPRNPQTLGASYQAIGNIYLKLSQSKEALINLQHALECFQEILPLTHPTFALLYNNIGLMYYKEEQYDDALKCYAKTLEIAAMSLPENHSLVGITLFNIALTYSSQEKFNEAIEYIEKSTEQFLKTLPVDHPDVLENKKYIEFIRQKIALKDIFDDNTTSF